MATRFFVAPGTTIIQNGCDGLFGLVRDNFYNDQLSGHLFQCANRDRIHVKVLVCDGSGLWYRLKRLKKARFARPKAAEGQSRITIRAEGPTIGLRGIGLAQMKARKGGRRSRVAWRNRKEDKNKLASSSFRLRYTAVTEMGSTSSTPSQLNRK